jgi:hypothetical protein
MEKITLCALKMLLMHGDAQKKVSAASNDNKKRSCERCSQKVSIHKVARAFIHFSLFKRPRASVLRLAQTRALSLTLQHE